MIEKGFTSKENNPVILSTIHSSKGKEYEDVYLLDVYDGRFPSSIPNLFSRSKDNSDGEQEERRLFYVGITRAKNHLYLFKIKDLPSSFVSELFPDVRENTYRSDEVFRESKRVNCAKCSEEILQIIDQQDHKALDSFGRRWVRCEECGEVKLEKDFSSYGGANHINLGICLDCARKHPGY